jgi:hypothetical protein
VTRAGRAVHLALVDREAGGGVMAGGQPHGGGAAGASTT